MTTTAAATMNAIRDNFALTVLRQTGAEVEFTMISADKFSIFTLDGERFDAVVAFLSRIDGMTLDTTEHYDEDGEAPEFYAYFDIAA